MLYLLPLMEDVIVDSHEIWWHVKHLLALHVTVVNTVENLFLMQFERRKEFEVHTELDIDGDLENQSEDAISMLMLMHHRPGVSWLQHFLNSRYLHLLQLSKENLTPPLTGEESMNIYHGIAVGATMKVHL